MPKVSSAHRLAATDQFSSVAVSPLNQLTTSLRVREEVGFGRPEIIRRDQSAIACRDSSPDTAAKSQATQREFATQNSNDPLLFMALTLPPRRTIRRTELHQIVPLANTTIYDMERRGEFPRRFNLTPRCVVWDLAEVEAWIQARREATLTKTVQSAPAPDVRRRKYRPVKGPRD